MASVRFRSVDLGNRTEARTALRTAMIHRHEHQDVFEQAFNLFWRDPTAAEQAAAMALLDAQKDRRRNAHRPAAAASPKPWHQTTREPSRGLTTNLR